jgi:hypothetical protein
MILSDAQRARLYRQRKAARSVANELFSSKELLTLSEFLEGLDEAFDEAQFYENLVGLGEETEEYKEQCEEVWQEAFDEAYDEAYEEHLAEAIASDDFDPNEDDDGDIRDAAEQDAREVADEAIKEWIASDERNYATECVEYELHELLQAYRDAHAFC